MCQLVLERDGEVAVLTINRPDRLNALTVETVAELLRALDQIRVDPGCRVLIVTGAGRGFCAGLDLTQASSSGEASPPASETMRRQEIFSSIVPAMRAMPQPVIAAVNGPAVGAGFALALGADLRLAAAAARFGVGAIRIGLSGGESGISWLLPRIVGATRAFDLMLTGRIIDAVEAQRIGLALTVVPDGDVLRASVETARLICSNSPFAVWMTKQVMWGNLEASSLGAALALENHTQVLALRTEDAREARTAFLEKRPPQFANR